MRELGFAIVGAVALIALGVCAARKAESEDVWSTGAAYNAAPPSQPAAGNSVSER